MDGGSLSEAGDKMHVDHLFSLSILYTSTSKILDMKAQKGILIDAV